MNSLLDSNLPISSARPRAQAQPMDAGRPAGPDLRRVWALFMRHVRVFGGVAALIFVGAVILTMQATPLYTATSNVMLDVRKQQVVSTEAVLSGLPADTAVVDSEVEVLKSR